MSWVERTILFYFLISIVEQKSGRRELMKKVSAYSLTAEIFRENDYFYSFRVNSTARTRVYSCILEGYWVMF